MTETLTYGKRQGFVRRHRKAVVTIAFTTALSIGSIAFAAFLVSGVGSGYGKSGTPVSLTVRTAAGLSRP